ncbi:MAG TPA: sulfide/dihydroorotate dehydrogenase-like FAD/NAD-binding protein [Candidatus Hydrogenedentes bacterium]|nr:MAG: NADP-reducing hydrogenase subunit HndC [Candidatus Hydrogenedentes bacterium ADurb.Bin179]HOH28863.1 sulfide/dihydroorotate dehydrogenase-like FAD/NAD-binding protein [Candidatus Hydrogenedentota bacterium]
MELTINGQRVTAEPNETVLKCALRHDIDIPHLCTHPSLPPFGACRMCMVEIEGMRGYPTACTTPAAEGMVVRTETEALRELRRNILGLMMLEHPSACLLCARREQCEEFRPSAEKVGRTTGCHTCNNKEVCDVRKLSEDLGFCELSVPPLYHFRPLERSEPFIDRDLNLCILCGRCVRVCKHQHDTSIIDFVGRSSIARIGEAFGRTLLDADCRFCGSCVDVCPTGSLADRFAKWFGKPDSWAETTCMFCDAGCALSVGVESGKAVVVRAVDPDRPLCVLGRFATAPFMNGTDRLRVPQVRIGKVLREVSWDDALKAAAEKLAPYKGAAFALVCDASMPLEDRYVLNKFTTEVMASPNYIELAPDARGSAEATLPGAVKAVLVTGNFLKETQRDALEALVVQDCYPSALLDKADAVFPAAFFTETDGTILDSEGVVRPLVRLTTAPGQARTDRDIVLSLGEALGAPGFVEKDTASIANAAGLPAAALYTERASTPAAASDPGKRRVWFRGHNLASMVGGLRSLPVNGDVPITEQAPATATPVLSCEKIPFQILSKREISPNNHEIKFYAPAVARKAKAGQFVILMADATSERVPYTLCDWDASEGAITLIVQEKGQSSRKLALMRAGDVAAHIVGPLGTPLEIDKFGTVVLLGGCYGIGAHIANAKALRAAGNHVILIVEARSHYLHYYQEELASVADEFIASTIDGSNGVKGHSIDVLLGKLKQGLKVDRVIAVGCPFMMKTVADETGSLDIPVWAALNPIMLDGTGMCGACRVTVDGKTKFACVDGPFFDAHLIDWEELKDRRSAYSEAEIGSLLTTEPVVHAHHAHGQGCGCGKA